MVSSKYHFIERIFETSFLEIWFNPLKTAMIPYIFLCCGNPPPPPKKNKIDLKTNDNQRALRQLLMTNNRFSFGSRLTFWFFILKNVNISRREYHITMITFFRYHVQYKFAMGWRLNQMTPNGWVGRRGCLFWVWVFKKRVRGWFFFISLEQHWL